MIPYPMYQQPQASTPMPGVPNYGQPAPQGFGQPSFPQAAAQPYTPPQVATQAPTGNTGWQPSPVLAAQALATNQPKARGYSPDPAPTPPSTPPQALPVAPPAPPAALRLPAPEELGIGRPAAPAAAVDWNQAHARMRELGVARFGVTRLGGAVRVSMELPGGQVVHGMGDSEAAALTMAFDSATR